MARPFRIYERLLAETQQHTESRSKRNRRQKKVAQSQTKVVKLDEGRDDGVFTGDEWPAVYLTERKLLREFARTKNIPTATIRYFIKKKLLVGIRFPNYRYEKYSTLQLQALIRNYNKLFLITWLMKAAILIMGILPE